MTTMVAMGSNGSCRAYNCVGYCVTYDMSEGFADNPLNKLSKIYVKIIRYSKNMKTFELTLEYE